MRIRAKLLGKPWWIRWVNHLPDRDPKKLKCGDCDTPDASNRSIRIRRNLAPFIEHEVINHECMHALDWHKDEDSWVAPSAHELTIIMWRLGYRRLDADELKAWTERRNIDDAALRDWLKGPEQ